MSGAASVTFDHVTKRYPGSGGAGTPGAVNDLSLEVPAGKICVLVGPSGCGKTTSLKMVNRLIEPTSGRILVGGEDVAARDAIELRRGIGYVIQQVGLFPHQTVVGNVETVPRLLGWDAARRHRRATELLELVGLEPSRYAARYPSQLSGGERQRVGVARALAADPPVLLMDEPFGAVDPIVRERLQNELLRLQESLAKTILFVTHDIDEAIKMGDLVAVMQAGGRLAQFGPPDEILASPASDFVARFVGADRGLKRLSLSRVDALELMPAVTASPGDDAAEARRRALADPFPYLLLVDAEQRPLGWIEQDDIPTTGVLTEELAAAMSPLLDRRTTLKDALARLVEAEVQAGIVVDRAGRTRGLVTAEMIFDWSRQTKAAAVASAAGADAVGGHAGVSAG
ncbi:MAG TPA: betaine/proline/choline family ABC transporter ATP-binding protein [Candidatus Limnocylindrales bacterium]|nr:betaine/proline/choline family ABC transporter ATP-binding protein [Candidatus Limnocylindrales bacterium]